MIFTHADIVAALEQCDFATDSDPAQLFADGTLQCRSESGVQLSTKLGVVRRGQERGTYVIFRGTESRGLGTWAVTNFQAASTAFRAVDPLLNHRGPGPELPIQGTASKTVAPGRVHQGFLRTWSQLWYGSDTLDTTFLEPSSAWRLFVRYAVVAGAAAGLAMWCKFDPVTAALFAVLFTMGVESGSLERLLWRQVAAQGRPLLMALTDSPPTETVWFVGHSLGGALATLSFSAYCNRCECIGVEYDARLITFGAPLVGDDLFVRDFERQHAGRFLHVVHNGDPVALSPAPKPRQLLRLLGTRPIGLWGPLLLASSAFWTLVYGLLWEGQRPYAMWEEKSGLRRLGGSHGGMSLFRHTRACYANQLHADG